MIPPRSTLVVPARLDGALKGLALMGGAAFVLGLWFAPARAWSGFLMGFYHLTALSLAGAVFVTLLTLARARWWTPMRRIPEAMTASLPYGLLLGLLLLFGAHTLYEWSHSSVVQADALLQHKRPYLNLPFFGLRLVLCFAIWILLTRRLVRPAPQPTDEGGARLERRRYLAACAFLPAFAVTFSVASIDWIKTLEPHWFSTIFGLVTLSGMALGGMAVVIVLVVGLRRQGVLRDVVTEEHLDDLGKITLGLALFWAYILYCQYMIVWYSNIPEDASYYVYRSKHGWTALRYTSLLLSFGVPFLVLMLRSARRSEAVLLRVAIVLLVGRLLDVYILVGPPVSGAPSLGPWELGPVVGALALYFRTTLRALASAAPIPRGDAELAAAAHGQRGELGRMAIQEP